MGALRSTKYGITNHNDSFTSTSSHSSGATSHENSDFDSQSSVSDTDYGELVDAGMIDLDEDVLAVNTNDPLAAFSKMEVSPRWELSPRLEYKRHVLVEQLQRCLVVVLSMIMSIVIEIEPNQLQHQVLSTLVKNNHNHNQNHNYNYSHLLQVHIQVMEDFMIVTPAA